MSTDGAVGFLQNGNITIIYNNMDSYPEGLGNDLLGFVKQWGLDRIKNMVANFVYVNDGSEGKCFYDFNDYFLEDDSKEDTVLTIHKKILVYNDINFVYNSLFCEWLYLVDLDKENLEIFKGFNDSKPNGRFSGVPPSENGYYAVTLVKTIALNNLPPKFYNSMLE